MMIILLAMACGRTKEFAEGQTERDSVLIRYYDDKSALLVNSAPDSAVYYAGLGLKLARRIHDLPGEALLTNRFARINEQYTNYRLSARYQERVIIIYQHLRQEAEADEARLQLSLLKAHNRDLSGAVGMAEHVLRHSISIKDTSLMMRSLIKLGSIYDLSNQYAKARQYYQQAEQLQQGRPATEAYIELLSRLGKLNVRDGQPEQALRYFNQAIRRSGNKITRTHLTAIRHAGKLLDSLGRHGAARAMHLQALGKARASGLREEEIHALMGLAGTLKQEDAETSVRHLTKALHIARALGHAHLAAEIYYSLSGIYHQQSRYSEAIEALKEHHRLLDSLLDVDKANRIAVLQSSYELTEAKLKVQTLELANQQQRYQRTISLLVTAAVLAILLLLAYNAYRTGKLVSHLKKSNQVKDKLFSIIGHDLRNPIGGITQLLAVMETDQLSLDEHHRLIVEMRKQGDVTLEILNALLNWGEAQLKGIHSKPAVFDSRESIERNIDALHRQVADKAITINNQVPAGLQVKGDINHFEFIIRNLLSNAIKFSYTQGLIDIQAQHQGTNLVIFSVQDRGKGISAAQQALFQRSEMGIAYGTKGEKGTGIGLMLCKEFVKANHGRIWLESAEGEGAIFYFSFPEPE